MASKPLQIEIRSSKRTRKTGDGLHVRQTAFSSSSKMNFRGYHAIYSDNKWNKSFHTVGPVELIVKRRKICMRKPQTLLTFRKEKRTGIEVCTVSGIAIAFHVYFARDRNCVDVYNASADIQRSPAALSFHLFHCNSSTEISDNVTPIRYRISWELRSCVVKLGKI